MSNTWRVAKRNASWRILMKTRMLTRRNLLKTTAVGLPLAATGLAGEPWPAMAQAVSPKTFVLAHGSWHGGWCWKRVADRLCGNGHAVYAPSYTGMGDRTHLLSKEITIDTFVEDLVQIIDSNELTQVILVGHSFGGVPISGVADRIPDRIARLVYLDSVVLESGKNAFSVYPPAEAEARIKAAEQATNGLAVPVPQQLPAVWGLGKEGDPDYDWVRRRLSPHPLRSFTTALTLRAPAGNGLPRTYVHCTQPSHPVLEDSRRLVRSSPGWQWVDVAAPHDAMITHPDEVVGLLLRA
jgi:pimeloyl-ACP methyl ester carboxylesterase